jgi:SpoVK/Ycf46/Vps4 family AAA+-type ATPase
MSGKYKLPKNIERDILKLSSLKIQIEDLDSTSPSHEESPNEGFGVVNESDEDDYDDDDDYTTNSYCDEVSFIEFAIINAYLHDCFKGKQNQVIVSSYGTTDSIGRLTFGGSFEITGSYWFTSKFEGDDNEYIFQTKMFVDNRNELINQINITCKKGIEYKKLVEFFKNIKNLAFNNSEFKGKCIKVKLRDGRFRGIEIIDIKESSNELILNDVQMKFIEHFISRVGRGGNARYLLNGEPGTGKTESIREIARKLIPNVTFIIPDFGNSDDLTSIMEACEIFENAVIIMDDIDLYLGSRDNGSYTRLLGQFLSFFDGVKKRKISLLASTNDKGLVDKAAERPGRFNFTLDYSFLDEKQIEKVCNIHLEEKWRIQEVYDALTGTINGKKVNITGAFIANLADNIKEMSEDDEKWSLEDTISLIKESYKGFYSSQVDKEKSTMGFQTK